MRYGYGQVCPPPIPPPVSPGLRLLRPQPVAVVAVVGETTPVLSVWYRLDVDEVLPTGITMMMTMMMMTMMMMAVVMMMMMMMMMVMILAVMTTMMMSTTAVMKIMMTM